ncbi:MAG TPA: hypothetical protein VM784_11660 [Actinomycetota bacterium]|nr:hypothetical protein [Actinomycetota bacterium]
MAEQDNIHEGAAVDSIRCAEVSGVADCDYVAELDESVERADRGSLADQLLAQLTSHIAKKHSERALSPDDISRLRDKVSAGPEQRPGS